MLNILFTVLVWAWIALMGLGILTALMTPFYCWFFAHWQAEKEGH